MGPIGKANECGIHLQVYGMVGKLRYANSLTFGYPAYVARYVNSAVASQLNESLFSVWNAATAIRTILLERP